MPSKNNTSMRPFSSVVFDGLSRAPSRAMLYPVGYKESDFAKPQIGIASTWSMVTPCNMHIDQLAREASLGVDAAGGKATIFDGHSGNEILARLARGHRRLDRDGCRMSGLRWICGDRRMR
jgi:dihydroxy-acid dehydratase